MTTHDTDRSTDSSAAAASHDMPMTDRDPVTEPDAPTETAPTATDGTGRPAAEGEQLVSQEAALDLTARWEAIQQGFVDNPRSAVSDADSLVGDVLQKLSASFEEQHRQLEAQWTDGEPDTENLRSAFQRYRDFFDRLLSI